MNNVLRAWYLFICYYYYYYYYYYFDRTDSSDESVCYCFIEKKQFVILIMNNNISAISWQSVLFVEEAGAPRENHQRSSQVTD